MGKAQDLIDLFEMATFNKMVHGLDIDIKMNVLQPGQRKLPHGPRVKVFRGSTKKGEKQEFSVSISDAPKIEAGSADFLNSKELKSIIGFVKDNHVSLLQFWNDPDMSVDELKDLLKT